MTDTGLVVSSLILAVGMFCACREISEAFREWLSRHYGDE